MNSLEQENKWLRSSLDALIAKATDNQRIHTHFQHFEMEVLSCRTLLAILHKLLVDAPTHFELKLSRLVWLDSDDVLRKLLDHEDMQQFEGLLEFVHELDTCEKLFATELRPQLKTLDERDKARWFPWMPGIASAAMLPLVSEGRLFGCLLLGSSSARRFTPDKGVDFMERLAIIVSNALESCVNQEHLRRMSLIDMLTRVKNRRSFDEDLNRELSRASRSYKPLSCLFIDLDHFKQVNDTFGHQAGDKALKVVAQLIGDQLRQTDHLARYGGEEFAALLPDCGQQTAVHIAERIRQMVESSEIFYQDLPAFSLTLSVGLSTWTPLAEEQGDAARIGSQLVAAADMAVYEAKRTGRNRVCVKSLAQGATALTGS